MKNFSAIRKTAFEILKPETSFYVNVLIYGIAISLLTLAIPISVQTLINTIVNTAIENQVLILALILFIILFISGGLYALQKYTMELFKRKFFTRIVSDIVMRTITADTVYFRNINRAELVNRYFDIMTVQKFVPAIMTGGFSLILQIVVGLILTSFYHPAFLIFNMVFIACIYLIWRVWGHRATRGAIDVSSAKYNVARALENIATAHTDFKSHNHIVHALSSIENLSAQYIEERKSYFSASFKQIVSFLFLYALFSAALLGIGGVLVIRGELSLGQLVAAELILSAIFYGISRAGNQLMLFYELVAALEKISYFNKIPTEKDEGRVFAPSGCFEVVFKNVMCEYRNTYIHFDFSIPRGKKLLATSTSHVLQEYFIDMIEAYRFPEKGQILLGGQDITEIDAQEFRDRIFVLEEPHLLDCTIEEYIKIYAPDASKVEIMDVLALVHMDDAIAQLPDGLKTRIISSGYPLSKSESIRLKLACTLLSHPAIIVLTELFDIVGYHHRQSILKSLYDLKDVTLIYFTNRRDLDFFQDYLYLDWNEDVFFKNIDDFRDAITSDAHLKMSDIND